MSWPSWASSNTPNGNPSEGEEAQDLIDLRQVTLFDAIDKLGRLALASDIEYPQLVVVGDQSCGKSSVLEAIGRFRFPVSDLLCTRFPTKLILRRSAQEHERVFIEPGTSRTANDRFILQQFGGLVTESAVLSEWIRRATVVLGVSPATDGDTGLRVAGSAPRQFTDDVLVIEKHGPGLPMVNLVDLPGVFRATDMDGQDETSREMVFEMVQDYVRSQQNFILLVISARNTVYNHSGLGMVQRIAQEDASLMDRVVGVITNPDHSLSVRETLGLLLGRHSSDILGCKWHLVKNQDQTQRSKETLVQRDRREAQFFATSDMWGEVPGDQKGIAALNATLREAFREHTLTTLPRLISEIRAKISSIDRRLSDVGSSRSTDKGRRRLLVSIASKFRALADKACSGVYEDGHCKELHEVGVTCQECEPFFRKAQDMKLRANIRALNKSFSSAMLAYGKTTEVLSSPKTEPARGGPAVPADLANPTDSRTAFPPATTTSKYYTHTKPEPVVLVAFEDWVDALIPKWSAKEPTGEASEAAYHQLFMDESKNWPEIAGRHLEAVWESVLRFVDLALAAACPYPDLRDALEKRLVNTGLRTLKKKSHRTLNDLLHCHRHGGTGFYDAIIDARAARRKPEKGNPVFDGLPDMIGDAVFQHLSGVSSPLSPVILSPVRSLVSQAVRGAIQTTFGDNSATDTDASSIVDPASEVPKRASTTAGRVIQHVEENYETSLVSFVGYVNALVVESGILRELPTAIFTPDIVMLESDNMINDIAGEKDTDAKRRERDERDLEELQAVMDVLENHMSRRNHNSVQV
ncbi:P-loop containing nucleoside triphosphate hydrolase protein [Chaetomium fimeti]|uniref:P-loop containing nucleoside triphosphate hydrolase protein n=1 Tax=Chaetomium fimeti TaxID=1854472 RepID=A0AAE0HHE3_9PEZI|nr:P-loop containing nucleoside triphosphate hydrolase protein [Chaetomium fimeti]